MPSLRVVVLQIGVNHMQRILKAALHLLVWCFMAAWAHAQPLVSAQWLQAQAKGQVQLIDTRFGRAHAAARIPGAASLDVLGMSFRGLDPGAEIARVAKTAGLQAERPIVIYDEGADMNATSLYFEMLHQGYPMDRVHVLDGGFKFWKQIGGALEQGTPTLAAPSAASTFTSGPARPAVLAQLSDVLAAPSNGAVLVEALQPNYFHATLGYFDRKGHIPQAKLMPHGDFFVADGRFKSPAALREMYAHQGVKPSDPSISYCGGGVAASVPWFAAHALLGQSQAKLYKSSLMEYMRDDRQLPLWTYGDESLRRNAQFVSAWTSPNFSVRRQGQVKAIDVRSAADFARGHVAASLSMPADAWPRERSGTEWQAALRAQGVSARHELVILGPGGITPAAAWAWWLSVQAGQPRASIAWEGMDEFAIEGVELAKGAPKASPGASASASASAGAGAGASVGAAAPTTSTALPVQASVQWIATAVSADRIEAPAQALSLAYGPLLDRQQKPLSAPALWAALEKAGVSRLQPIAVTAKDPAEAAVLVYLLRLMGFATARVG